MGKVKRQTDRRIDRQRQTFILNETDRKIDINKQKVAPRNKSF